MPSTRTDAKRDEFKVVDCRHQKGGQIRIWARGYGHIANVLASGPNPMGHARLIAAAPDLLDACKAAFGRLQQLESHGHDPALWYGPDGKPNTLLGRMAVILAAAKEDKPS